MIIIHFASAGNDMLSGVGVAVPWHVMTQAREETVGLVNIRNVALEAMEEACKAGNPAQLPFTKPFDVRKLPPPYDHPDLAVFHECYRPDYLAVARNLRKYGIPYIVCPHGELRAEAQRKKALKKKAANLLLFNSFVNHAAAVQCLSGEELKATGFGKRKFIGTNGVNAPASGKEHFSTEGVRFLYIGRYEWRVKGLDLLMEAIRLRGDLLRAEKARFDFYGPDILGRLDEVRGLVAEQGVGDLVSLHTEILGEEKQKALLDAEIFIQTSRHEGMPMGILEAMYLGLPVLITEGTTLAGPVRKAGCGWTAKTEAESIAAALEQAVRDSASWASLGQRGRELAASEYDWEVVSHRNLEEYRRILAK